MTKVLTHDEFVAKYEEMSNRDDVKCTIFKDLAGNLGMVITEDDEPKTYFATDPLDCSVEELYRFIVRVKAIMTRSSSGER
jgi:hypothetical protein